MPVTTDREYRRINVADLETRDDQDGMIVEGYATTFDQYYTLFDDVDYRVLEQVDAHAFDETDMSDVIMQYDHAGRVFARNRNNTLTLKADEHGLHIRADLSGTEIGRQLYQEIKGGYTDKMSFGFTVAKDERRVEEDRENNRTTVYRTIKAIKKLYDVSAVSMPANGMTEISATRSLCDGLIAEAKQEQLAMRERARRVQKINLMLEVLK